MTERKPITIEDLREVSILLDKIEPIERKPLELTKDQFDYFKSISVKSVNDGLYKIYGVECKIV